MGGRGGDAETTAKEKRSHLEHGGGRP